MSTTAPHLAAVSNATAVHSSITPSAPALSSVRASLLASVTSDVDRPVADGARIVAIKQLREHTGLGLKESKDLIEAWVPGLTLSRPASRARASAQSRASAELCAGQNGSVPRSKEPP